MHTVVHSQPGLTLHFCYCFTKKVYADCQRGSVGKGACCQAEGPEFNPQDPCDDGGVHDFPEVVLCPVCTQTEWQMQYKGKRSQRNL